MHSNNDGHSQPNLNDRPVELPWTQTAPKVEKTRRIAELIMNALGSEGIEFHVRGYDMLTREDANGIILDITLTKDDDPGESIVLNIDIVEAYG